MRQLRKHFKLKRLPFSRVIGEGELFKSEDMERVKDEIEEAIYRNGMLAVVGSVGAGKSTILGEIMNEIYSEVAFIEPTMAEKEYLRLQAIISSFIVDLSDEQPKRSMEFRERQAKRIVGELSVRKKVVIVIDEAHLLLPATLKAIKRIREWRFGLRSPLFSVILFGQTKLRETLRTYQEVGLRTKCIKLKGLTKSEVKKYIKFHSALAGCANLFEEKALNAIAKHENLPLKINVICEKALYNAYYEGEQVVTLANVEAIIKKQFSIKALAKEYGIAAREIAEELGCARSTVTEALNGNYDGKTETEQEILGLLRNKIEEKRAAA